MYKKKLINLCAVTLAMSLAFAPAVTTFAADDTQVTEMQRLEEDKFVEQ